MAKTSTLQICAKGTLSATLRKSKTFWTKSIAFEIITILVHQELQHLITGWIVNSTMLWKNVQNILKEAKSSTNSALTISSVPQPKVTEPSHATMISKVRDPPDFLFLEPRLWCSFTQCDPINLHKTWQNLKIRIPKLYLKSWTSTLNNFFKSIWEAQSQSDEK